MKVENDDVINPEKASAIYEEDFIADDNYSEIDSECEALEKINPMEQMLYGVK